jgi:outer membrane protein TolC
MSRKPIVGLTLACIAVILIVALTGCSKVRKQDQFYEIRVPEKKLKQIEMLDPDSMSVDESDTDAQETEIPAEPNQPPATLEISLEQYRALTLANNLDIQASLITPSIAQANLLAEEAKFEATFTARASMLGVDQPAGKIVEIPGTSTFVTSIGSSQRESQNIDLGVNFPLQTGGTVSFNIADGRSKNLRENSILSPWYEDRIQISISQPLLRNAGKRANMHSIRLARYQKQIQDNTTKLEVIRVLAAADRTYWRLYAASKELDVRRQQHDLAMAQLERAKRFVEAGQFARVEILRAEAGVSRQLAEIITADNSLRDRLREFKRTKSRPGIRIDTRTVMIPTTEPDPVHYVFDSDKLITQAFDNRSELMELELRLAEDASRIDFARNQALPVVNLDYNYNISGVGPMRSDSLDMLNDKNYENHYLGVSLWVPLGNDQNRNRLRAAVFARRQRLAARNSRLILTIQEVLNAIDQVEANWQQILASRQSSLLEAELYQAEIRQFEVGLRTSTDVLEAQTNFANAQSAEIAALTNYQISLVDMAFATGTLLGAAKVEWEPIEPDIGIKP